MASLRERPDHGLELHAGLGDLAIRHGVGDDAGTGPFTVSVDAANGGEAVTSRNLVWAPVAAVSVPASGSPVLTVPGIGQVAVGAVRQVG